MREIKFRALRGDGVWYYFDFENSQRWAKELLQKMAETDTTFDFDTPFLQYTGLKDKNGKEIYEGDIVEYRYGDLSGGHAEVIFQEGCFEVGNGYISALAAMYGGLEILGNIYEHSYLLDMKTEK